MTVWICMGIAAYGMLESSKIWWREIFLAAVCFAFGPLAFGVMLRELLTSRDDDPIA